MQVTIETSALKKALTKLSKALHKAHGLVPALYQCLANVTESKRIIELSATNLEFSVMVRLSCSSPEAGRFTFDLRHASGSLKAWKDKEVVLIPKENNVVVFASGMKRFVSPGLPVGDLPDHQLSSGIELARIAEPEFIQMIEQVAPMAAQYDNGSVLGAVVLDTDKDRLAFGATDGSRMSYQQTSAKLYEPAKSKLDMLMEGYKLTNMLPADKLLTAFKGMKNFGHIKIFLPFDDSKQWILATENHDYVVSLMQVAGQYPRYKELFPEDSKLVTYADFDTLALMQAAESVKAFNGKKDRTKIVLLNGLNVASQCDPENKEHYVSCDIAGNTDYDKLPLIALSYEYLIQWLKPSKLNAMRLKILSESLNAETYVKPLIFEDKQVKHLLMPVQSSHDRNSASKFSKGSALPASKPFTKSRKSSEKCLNPKPLVNAASVKTEAKLVTKSAPVGVLPECKHARILSTGKGFICRDCRHFED